MESTISIKNQVFACYAAPVLILILSVAAFWHLSVRLISQIHCHKAAGLFQEGHYDLAANSLQNALRDQPKDHNIQKMLGRAHFEWGKSETDPRKAFLLIRKSKDFHLRALEANPLDADTAYHLAMGEARLQGLYQHLYPKNRNNPYQPLPFFKAAIRLRPNGIQYNYALARYLHQHGNEEELLRLVRGLGRIYPLSHSYLRKEKFWSPHVAASFKAGLGEAIKENTSVKDAHTCLSLIWADEADWPAAISHYQKSLNYKTFQNHSGNYVRLGHLFLKNEQFPQAEASFLHALNMSPSVERDIERVYSLYKREAHVEKFRQFCQNASRNFILSSRMDILMARSLIDLKQYEPAKKVLTELNHQAPDAQAYYWLSHIAQLEKDWDSMELAIQKATLHDPENSQYHLIFSNVLKRLKKMDRAEKEAGLAIEHQANPSPWLFNHRAWIRWNTQDYVGATEDWKSAIALKPDRADFHAYAAQAYKNMGDRSQAIVYYQKALDLDPNNNSYHEKYLEVKAWQ